jgi:Asp-tRNA(Asn)/Glu-tRNA(Gln) amidotransferase A subunit family amidase
MTKIEPCFLSATEASQLIEGGQLTSEELVRSCLERIFARDSSVKAWLQVDERAAIQAAREADKRPRQSRYMDCLSE